MSDEKTKLVADLERFAKWCRAHNEAPGVCVFTHNADDIEALLGQRAELLSALKALALDLNARRVPGVHFEDRAPTFATMTLVMDAIARAEAAQ